MATQTEYSSQTQQDHDDASSPMNDDDMLKEASNHGKKEGRIMFPLFTILNAVLLMTHHDDIPQRDIDACKFGGIALLAAYPYKFTDRPRPKSNMFRRAFAILSLCEVVFTIVTPWMVILLTSEVDVKKRVTYQLVPHLFVFQTQIVLESVIMLEGKGNKWMTFPFTCVANMYRLIPLITWVLRVNETLFVSKKEETTTTSLEGFVWLEVMLPAIATALWLYSSFVFIPYIWYPLLKQTETKSG